MPLSTSDAALLYLAGHIEPLHLAVAAGVTSSPHKAPRASLLLSSVNSLQDRQPEAGRLVTELETKSGSHGPTAGVPPHKVLQ